MFHLERYKCKRLYMDRFQTDNNDIFEKVGSRYSLCDRISQRFFKIASELNIKYIRYYDSIGLFFVVIF